MNEREGDGLICDLGQRQILVPSLDPEFSSWGS